MIFRQLFDQVSSTYTYLLADQGSRQALLIDCVFEQHARDAALLNELELQLLYALDTHCHADHVTGAWLMREKFGSQIGLSPEYAARNVDLPLTPGLRIGFGRHELQVRATPGHTAGCVSFVCDELRAVFSGDALLVRGAGRTDFQHGSAQRLFHSVHEQLLSLPDDYVVYPAHDYEGRTCSTIGEERRFNPRLGGAAREEDFVGYMNNLGLPHPKLLSLAVPANLRAGEPETGQSPAAQDWGPLVTTYAGLREIAPDWVARHRAELHVLDVREVAELSGEFGVLTGVQHIPLGELARRSAEVPSDRAVVIVCQSGKRSGLATQILLKAGHQRVANVAGGMVRWRELGLPD